MELSSTDVYLIDGAKDSDKELKVQPGDKINVDLLYLNFTF